MVSEKDRRHADLGANFFAQLGVAFVAGAFLQVLLVDIPQPSNMAWLFMTGLGLWGVAHIVIERSYGAPA